MQFRFIVFAVLSLFVVGSASNMKTSPLVGQKKLPTKALDIRGGGIVSKETFNTVNKFLGFGFAAQMLFVPKMFFDMNFDEPYDKIKEFLMRFMGFYLALFSQVNSGIDTDAQFMNGMIATAGATILGPISAELMFKTKPAHKIPCVLLPATLAVGALAMM